MADIKILIACGSGIATSTVAHERVKEILRDNNVTADIRKGSLGEIALQQDDVDLIFVTTRYDAPTTKPVVSIFGLISGVNEEQTVQDVISACNTVLDERHGR